MRNNDWLQTKWRPLMAGMYLVVCVFDFIVFPILWVMLQSSSHTVQITQWQPLTLQSGGLFHIAMGGILGIAAWGRTKEKLARASDNTLNE